MRRLILPVLMFVILALLVGCGKPNPATPNQPAQPVVVGFSPTSGGVGTRVSITGSNFDPILSNNIVKFNGIPTTAQGLSKNGIIVTVPYGATTGLITVATGAGTASSAAVYTVLPSVHITLNVRQVRNSGQATVTCNIYEPRPITPINNALVVVNGQNIRWSAVTNNFTGMIPATPGMPISGTIDVMVRGIAERYIFGIDSATGAVITAPLPVQTTSPNTLSAAGFNWLAANANAVIWNNAVGTTPDYLFILWNGVPLSGFINFSFPQTIFVIPVNTLTPGNNQTLIVGAFKDLQLTGPAPTISAIYSIQAQAAVSVEDTPVVVNVR